jgi:hypothetical protein
MPDARAHGTSGGEIATYGIREANDLHRWLDWLDLNEHPACIYGFAESMGAAGLLQSLQSESRFAQSPPNHPFPLFVKYPTIASDNFFTPVPGWVGQFVDPWWNALLFTRDGGTT